MGKTTKIGKMGKRAKTGVVLIAMSAFLLTMSVQPARAITVTDPLQNALFYTHWALQELENKWQQTQLALNGVLTSASAALTTQANAVIADTEAANTRTNTQFQLASQIQMDYARPSNFSACHVVQSSLTESNNEIADDAMAQAFTQANQNSPTDAITNSAIMLNQCTLCFAPVYNQRDPEYGRYTALGCPPCPGGTYAAGNFARADLNVASVMNPDGYLVPPNFPKQLATGVYAPVPKPPSDKYEPFLAAYTFCQHQVPISNPPPQATPNSPPRLEFLSGGFKDTTRASGAATMCFRSLSQRMQFDDQTTNNWPAGNPNTAIAGQPGPAGVNVPGLPNGIVTRHDEQYAQCLEDFGANHLDVGQLQDCAKNGRSEYMALKNKLYGNGQVSNMVQNLSTQKAGPAATQINQNRNYETSWRDKKTAETNALVAAEGASGSSPAGGQNAAPSSQPSAP